MKMHLAQSLKGTNSNHKISLAVKQMAHNHLSQVRPLFLDACLAHKDAHSKLRFSRILIVKNADLCETCSAGEMDEEEYLASARKRLVT